MFVDSSISGASGMFFDVTLQFQEQIDCLLTLLLNFRSKWNVC